MVSFHNESQKKAPKEEHYNYNFLLHCLINKFIIVFKIVDEGYSKIGDETLNYFLELKQQRKGLVSVNSVTT